MHNRPFGIRLALVATLALPLASCTMIEAVKGARVIKDAHKQYQRSDYEGAVHLYEEALANDPDLVDAHFFLGNSYDQMFRTALRGEPVNDEYLEKAIDHYITSAELQTNQQMQTLSLQYLVAAFGPEKGNSPASSEPVLQQMIKTDPTLPDNYFALAKLYEDSGLVDQAEEQYLLAREQRGDDPNVYLQLAAFYSRVEEFDKTIEALRRRSEIEPDNPEAFYTIGTYYWEKAFRDFTITEETEIEYVALGLEELDKAIMLNADYMEALTYKNILLRMQANLTTDDQDLQEALIAEADVLRDRAEELQRLRTGAAN